jgi:hypothetical protein
MKIKVGLFILTSALLSLTSCMTYVTVPKLLPPEIELFAQSNNIVFFNNFDYTNPRNTKEKHEVTYHAGVKGLIAGISSSFSGDSTVHFVVGDTLSKKVEKGFHAMILRKDSVQRICASFEADRLMAMDSLKVFFDWETLSPDNPENSSLKTKNYYLHFLAFISLYDANGDLINRSEMEKSSLYTSRAALSGLITIQPMLSKARKEVEALAALAGEDYVKKFYPQTTTETEKLYSGKIFSESNLLIGNNDCTRAIEILYQLADSPNPKTAKKAEHNLSIAKKDCGKIIQMQIPGH